jgi:hypothetical protein
MAYVPSEYSGFGSTSASLLLNSKTNLTMDPLSIAASITGVATAGAQISLVLFDMVNKMLHANKAIEEIATEMSHLSAALESIQDILHEGMRKKLYKECLLSNLHLLLKRIDEIHALIRRKTNRGANGLQFRIKWGVLGSAQTQTLIAKLAGVKSTLNVMLSTMQLALYQRTIKCVLEKKNHCQ